MFEVFKCLSAGLSMADNYDKRVIARTEVDGFTVSTANTSDYGDETAILDANGTYPVQRYETREQAQAGHLEWVEKIKSGLRTVTQLGGYGLADEEKPLVSFSQGTER